MMTSLEKWRRENGLNHDQVGRQCNRTGRTVRRWEKREARPDPAIWEILRTISDGQIDLADWFPAVKAAA